MLTVEGIFWEQKISWEFEITYYSKSFQNGNFLIEKLLTITSQDLGRMLD